MIFTLFETSLLAEGEDTGAVSIRSLPAHTVLWRAEIHQGAVLALAFSPDGKYLASGGSDAKVQIWEVQTGAVLFTYEQHAGPVLSLAWSPEGRQIASSAPGEPVHLWEPFAPSS